MVDYIGAIKKPTQDIQTLIIGIILGMIPVISLLNLGFAVGVGRATIKGDNKLPAWDPNQIVTYIKDIVFVLIITLVYMIPALILFAIALAGFIVGAGGALGALAAGNSQALSAAVLGGLGTGGIFALLGLVLAVAGGVMASMGIFFYIKEGSLGAAFKFGAILKKVLTVTYLVTLVVYIVYAFVLGILAAILSIIPVLGAFLAAGILSFLTNVTSYTLLGQVFKETP
ncbi:MAG TPA: DUF4013 domain-containing protein [archaeon]|nr:DUF4013 domain-containing protein [archaeon]